MAVRRRGLGCQELIAGGRGLEDLLMAEGRGLEDLLMAGGRGLEDCVMAGGRGLEDLLMAGGRGLEDLLMAGGGGWRISSGLEMEGPSLGLSPLFTSIHRVTDYLCNGHHKM